MAVGAFTVSPSQRRIVGSPNCCRRRLKMTPCRRPNFDPLRLTLGLRAERRRELLAVEDWAEIRRLHRAEGLPIKLIARTLGISRNTVRAALASEEPPKYVRQPAGSAGGCVRGRDPRPAQGGADDAGDGDRRAGGLDPWDDG